MVDDDEQLYRRVLNNQFSTIDGRLRLSSESFSDRERKPSVDRARLIAFDPKFTQKKSDSGVAWLIAEEVRAIEAVTSTSGNTVTVHKPDVLEDPIPQTTEGPANPAHAIVVTNPPVPGPSAFRKLATALAELASRRGWKLPPS